GQEDDGLALFHEWSMTNTEKQNFDPQDCDDLWQRSDPDRPGGTTVGSLVQLAKDFGWEASANVHPLFPPLSEEEMGELRTQEGVLEVFVAPDGRKDNPQPNPKKLPPDPGATGATDKYGSDDTEPEILLGMELRTRRFRPRDWLIDNLLQERELLLL